jgi:FkbM family methyltransferase
MSKLKGIVRAAVPRSVRNWLRAPAKSISWSWDETRFLFGARETIELRPGFRLVCHPLAYRHSYFAQNDDPAQAAEFDCFVARCTPKMILFDLGAHFGLFSLAALHYGGPDAVAVAVDASPVAIRMINIQSSLNHLESRLTSIEACICADEGVADMVAIGPLADGYFTSPTLDTAPTETTKTTAITLDGLVAKTGRTPTHVKIDVEGFEESVLQGGRRLLQGSAAPLLFLELHNEIIRAGGRRPEAVLDLVGQYGYRTFDFQGAALEREAVLAQPIARFQAWKTAAS